ncbi:MAG: hypothetical protein AMXMBFR13_41760 [Phycisphaerae bacterium]
MKAMHVQMTIIALFVAAFSAPVLAQHAHEGDLIVGVQGGQLAVEFHFDEAIELHPVAPNIFGIEGFSADEPGFDHADGTDPDLGALSAGAEIWLVGLTPFDAALKVRQPAIPFDLAIDAAGGDLLLGDHELHTHAFWHLDSTIGSFDPLQASWQGTFKLVDRGTTGYAESQPFTLSFVIVPEPAAAVLLLSALPLTLRRRRRG